MVRVLDDVGCGWACETQHRQILTAVLGFLTSTTTYEFLSF